MACKLIVFAAFAVAAVRCGIIGAPAVVAPGPPLAYAGHPPQLAYSPGPSPPVAIAPAPVKVAAPPPAIAIAKAPAIAVDTDFDPNPQYSYAYEIQDTITGDSKGQQETRNGDVVQGSYSLVEPDGTRRTVEYTADAVNGFNAIVHREAAKTVVAPGGPVVAKIGPPLTYSSPVAKVNAPIAYTGALHPKAIIG